MDFVPQYCDTWSDAFSVKVIVLNIGSTTYPNPEFKTILNRMRAAASSTNGNSTKTGVENSNCNRPRGKDVHKLSPSAYLNLAYLPICGIAPNSPCSQAWASLQVHRGPVGLICLSWTSQNETSNEQATLKAILSEYGAALKAYSPSNSFYTLGIHQNCSLLDSRCYVIPTRPKANSRSDVITTSPRNTCQTSANPRNRKYSDEFPIERTGATPPPVATRSRSISPPPVSGRDSSLGRDEEVPTKRQSVLNWIRGSTRATPGDASPGTGGETGGTRCSTPIPDRKDPRTGLVIFGTADCRSLEADVRALAETVYAKLAARLDSVAKILSNARSPKPALRITEALHLPYPQIYGPYEKVPSLLRRSGQKTGGFDLWKGWDLNDRSSKKKCLARHAKQLGDYYLLFGLTETAFAQYNLAIEANRSLNDPLWVAASLEGWCCAAISKLLPFHRIHVTRNSTMSKTLSLAELHTPDTCSSPSPYAARDDGCSTIYRSPVKSLHSSFRKGKGQVGRAREKLEPSFSAPTQGSINLNELSEVDVTVCKQIAQRMREVIDMYDKVPEAVSIQVEAIIKTAYFHAYLKQNLKAACYIQEALFLRLDLSDADNVKRYLALSQLYALIGMKRKEAFYKRVASLQSVSPSLTNPNWKECSILLTQCLNGYMVPLDLKDASKKRFQGWPSLQIRVINELIVSARRCENYPLAARYVMFQLQFLRSHLSGREIQENLDLLKAFSCRFKPLGSTTVVLDNGTILPPVPLPHYPILVKVDFPELSPSLNPVWIGGKGGRGGITQANDKSWVTDLSATPTDDNPFIFSPFVSKRARQRVQRGRFRRRKNDGSLESSSDNVTAQTVLYGSQSSIGDVGHGATATPQHPENDGDPSSQCDALWVQGEPVRILFHLVNPLPTNLALNYMGILSNEPFREIRPLLLPTSVSPSDTGPDSPSQNNVIPFPSESDAKPPLLILPAQSVAEVHLQPNKPGSHISRHDKKRTDAISYHTSAPKITVFPTFVVPESNGTFNILGYYTELYDGVRSNIKSADLKCFKNRSSGLYDRALGRSLNFPYTIKVTPALPLLRYTTSFPMVPDDRVNVTKAASLNDGPAIQRGPKLLGLPKTHSPSINRHSSPSVLGSGKSGGIYTDDRYQVHLGTEFECWLKPATSLTSCSSPSLNDSPDPSTQDLARSPVIFASLYMGQSLECPITLTNLGEVPLDKISIGIHGNDARLFTPLLSWKGTSLNALIPLNPNTSKTFTVTIYGGDEMYLSDGVDGSTKSPNGPFNTLPLTSHSSSRLEALKQPESSKFHQGKEPLQTSSLGRDAKKSSNPALKNIDPSPSVQKIYHRTELKVTYSGNDSGSHGFGREMIVPFCIETKPIVSIAQCDVLPAENLSSCYLVLDLTNVDATNEVCIQYTTDKKVDIEPLENTKIALEINKIKPAQISRFYSPDSTKSGSPIFSEDFVAPPVPRPSLNTVGSFSASPNIYNIQTSPCPADCLPAIRRSNQLPPTINELLDSQIHITWKLVSKKLEGRIRLFSLVWTEPKLDILIMPQITWELELDGQTCKSGQTAQVSISTPCSVAANIRNNSDKDIQNIHLSIKCYQDHQNGYYDYDLSEKVVFVGSLNRDIDKIARSSTHKHETRFVFLCPGIYYVQLICNKSTPEPATPASTSTADPNSTPRLSDDISDKDSSATSHSKTSGATPWAYTPKICINVVVPQ